MHPLLDPKLDVIFKLLFSHERNRNLLVSLLTAVLDPPEPIVGVEVREATGAWLNAFRILAVSCCVGMILTYLIGPRKKIDRYAPAK